MCSNAWKTLTIGGRRQEKKHKRNAKYTTCIGVEDIYNEKRSANIRVESKKYGRFGSRAEEKKLIKKKSKK